jgi:hypothetical protein
LQIELVLVAQFVARVPAAPFKRREQCPSPAFPLELSRPYW